MSFNRDLAKVPEEHGHLAEEWPENIIDLVPIIVHNMPDIDPQYAEPAKVLRPSFGRKRGRAL